MQICMDWSSVTFDWNRVRAFLVTAEEGSLSAAARALGLAQPTLSRQVDALQTELGVVLFERFGRGLELTPAGADLIAHARKMGEAAMSLSIAAYGQSDVVSGLVTISASDAYAGLVLPPILKRLREQEPSITLRIVADNQATDLMRREADIALRNFRPKEPDLVARRLADAGANFFAAQAYIDRFGVINSDTDWANAQLIVPGPAEGFVSVMQSMGLPLTQASVAYECTSYLAMWEMVRQGLGVGEIDVRIGDADPSVSRVAPTVQDLPFPIWLTAHRDILSNRRLRLVYDFLADALSSRDQP
ncbi:MAG: LysR family transcriptional regulator [Marivita sp.]|nr:LysR family transcriptional regulator [Marivita sp.]